MNSASMLSVSELERARQLEPLQAAQEPPSCDTGVNAITPPHNSFLKSDNIESWSSAVDWFTASFTLNADDWEQVTVELAALRVKVKTETAAERLAGSRSAREQQHTEAEQNIIRWLDVKAKECKSKRIKAETLAALQVVHDTIQQFREILILEGNIPEPARKENYLGEKVGRFFWGQADQNGQPSILIEASGGLGAAAFPVFAPIMRNCSRIDLKTDVKFIVEDYRLQQKENARFLRMLRDPNAKKSLKGRPIKADKVVLIKNGYGGSSLIIGSPKSDYRGTIYNKWRESGKDEIYKNVQRYELRLRNEAAQKIMLHLRGLSLDAVEPAVMAECLGWFREKCVDIPQITGAVLERVKHIVEKVVSTVEKSLSWLEKQVSSTVRKLVAHGYENQVVAALGLRGLSGGDDLLNFAANTLGARVEVPGLACEQIGAWCKGSY